MAHRIEIKKKGGKEVEGTTSMARAETDLDVQWHIGLLTCPSIRLGTSSTVTAELVQLIGCQHMTHTYAVVKDRSIVSIDIEMQTFVHGYEEVMHSHHSYDREPHKNEGLLTYMPQ